MFMIYKEKIRFKHPHSEAWKGKGNGLSPSQTPQPRGPITVLVRPCSICWLWTVTQFSGPHPLPPAIPVVCW